jgi:hypothetical protein
MERRKQQVPPLRFAPVGMTNLFKKLDDFARKIIKVTAFRDDKREVNLADHDLSRESCSSFYPIRQL